MPLKVALILGGVGVYDGSEVTESVAAIVQLSRNECETHMFALDKEQMHTVNHLTGEEIPGEKRNVLIESARIARGNIKPISNLDCEYFDALIIPGGFGVAKNLSNFAVTLGSGNGGPDDFQVDPSVASVIESFHASKKIIGACCIAPTIVAKVIKGVSVTLGCSSGEMFPYAGATKAITALGGNHVETPAPCSEVCVDKENLVVTSGGYMYDGKPHQIADSVAAMVDKVVEIANA